MRTEGDKKERPRQTEKDTQVTEVKGKDKKVTLQSLDARKAERRNIET